MSFRAFLSTANDFTSLILKIAAIALICVAVTYGGLSIAGNIVEATSKPKPPPDIDKAAYEVELTATGQMFYTDQYTALSDTAGTMSGYYELVKNKWIYRDGSLILDERYFGDIKIKRR